MEKHNRIIILSAFIMFVFQVSAQSFNKIRELPFNIIQSKWERNAQGDQDLNYYNEDYCDYYLYREKDRSYNLRPGNNKVFTLKNDKSLNNTFPNSTRYRYYRGKFPQNFNINTPYGLPVKNRQKTEWQIDPRESFKTLNFNIQNGDTVYATRSGIACKTSNSRQLLIYHPDQTFAAYLIMSENFIKPSQEVQIGQPIGKAGLWGVSIS